MGLETAIFFLASVAVISLSGVLMPGPVFAVTIACGFQDRWSGWKIALGHAVVEVPTIVAIFFGLSVFLKDDMVFGIIGILGGTILLYMGYDMVRSRKDVVTSCTKYRDPFWAGVMTTASNPAWLLWWATVGAALTATAVTFGWWMLPFFVVVHITCDLLWEGFMGMTIFDTKGRWSEVWHQRVIAGSGVLMVAFALLFVYNGLSSLL
jgi:threonine/homoserine/homoserine lactone efflux protein